MSSRRFRPVLMLFLISAAGCGTTGLQSTDAPSPGPTPAIQSTVGPATASPTVTASAAAATPDAGIPTLGQGLQQIDPGTYRISTDRLAESGSLVPPLLVTFTDGWNNINGNFMSRGGISPTVAVQFWNVHRVYEHPCQWLNGTFDPGPSVDNLAVALAERPMRNATNPVDVTLGGFSGKYLEWSVPADADFADCDKDPIDGLNYFESWKGSVPNTVDGDRYQQGSGQIDRLWILDVDGTRLVIDGFSMPVASEEDIQLLIDAVESATFET